MLPDSRAMRSRAAIGRFVTRLGVRIMRLGVRIENRPPPEDKNTDGMIAT